MSYIDALYSKNDDRIYVVERTVDGKRAYREYAADYTFYYADPKGKYRGLHGEPVTKFSTRKRREFEKERRVQGRKQLYESDINPVFRCLSQNYLGVDAPKLHTCFIDIEVDFDSERGFAPPEDPFNKITAITLYNDWDDQLITLVIAPPTISTEEADEICSGFENTLRFEREEDMFEALFVLIDDADVITGWNSEGYDIPYLVNRVIRVLSKDDTRRFCLMGQYPKAREYERFGKTETTYDLVGRVHMDYLQLYKKYNYESRHSYSLDSIAELELGERKTPYEGTLDQLYKRDFKQFITYNRQDVMLVFKIHCKVKFLELANQLAHENTVLLPTVMGSVAMIEQAVINEAHARGLVVPDKVKKELSNEQKAAGAYVATPQKGLHEYVGAVDINSLYPSVIRALNLAPETMVGQIRQSLTDEYMRKRAREIASLKKRRPRNQEDENEDDVTNSLLWEGLFGSLEYTAVMEQRRDVVLTIDYVDGTSEEYSAAQIWKLIFDNNNPWVLTANGTIFTYEVEGVIPGLLSKWYSERKNVQRQLGEITSIIHGIELPKDML